jgi:hypothetical protein
MALDYFEGEIEIPFDRDAYESGDGKRIALAQYRAHVELVRILKILQILINSLVSTAQTDWHYYGLPSPVDGTYPDGSWRTGVVDDEFQVQKMVSGSWKRVTGMEY